MSGSPAEKKLSIFEDPSKAFQVFSFIQQVAIIIGSIFLAKSAMPIENIGKFETLLYLGQFVSLFWISGLTQAFHAIYPKVALVERKSFISTTFTIFLFLSIASSLILILGRPLLLPFLIESPQIEGLYWFCLYTAINTPSMLIPSLLMLRGNSKELMRFSLFYGIGYILVFFLNFLFGGKLINLLILLNIYTLTLLLMSGGMALTLNLNAYRLKWAKRLFLIGSPLIGYSIISGMALIYDAWLVQRLYTPKAIFAIFRYGGREFPLTVTLAIGLGTALIPIISRNLKEGLEKIKSRSQRLYPLVFGTSIVLVLISKFIFPIIFSTDFISSAAIFNIYILIIISRMIYPHIILLGLRKTKALLYISIIELFINIIGSTILGFKFGLLGIAGGVFIAHIIGKIAQIIYLRKKLGIRLDQYLSVKRYLFYSLALILAWGISTYL
jgi:O-antigen/teichoic acid export membrane protein